MTIDSDLPYVASTSHRSARRRYLTIFFSDLCDSTELAESMEAEHYAAVLGEMRDACRTVIRKHGGTIVRIQGDGVMAIFGYPDAGEDDGRRATEAALELHDTVRRLRFEPPLPQRRSLGLHTGIHAGLVLLDEGDLVRGRFELMGKAPNIAARLSDLAGRDEILVSEETLGPESHFFETGERRLLALKGRDGTVASFLVRARADVGTRFEARARRGLAPFVGRDAEFDVLDRKLRETLAGEPRHVAVSAGAGLGKTRLVEEFLRRASSHDCFIYRGCCESYLGAEPLQPFLQMLGSVFGLDHGAPAARAAASIGGTLAQIDPALLTHRPEFLRALSVNTAGAGGAGGAGDGGPDARRAAPDAIITAITDLFSRLAARKPLLLFLDDWQFADDASSQVLSAIRALPLPIFVLMATRGFSAGDASMSAADILLLSPLDDGEAADSIVQLVPGIDPFIAAEIRRYAGGNPLYIEELCHSAAHADSPLRLGHMHEGAGWLNALVESRVARLPPAQAELVRAAAVIGNVIPVWLLESITGCAEDHPLVRGLALHDFVFPGERAGTLRFKHGITRDVVYHAVGLHARQSMHLRIAQALQQRSAGESLDEACEALAYHYGAGGQVRESAQFAEMAGDKAVSASALDRAKTQYRAALAALDQLPPSDEVYRRWTTIAQRLGLASVFDPSREELEVFRRAVAIARERGDERAIARAEYWLGYISYALGETHQAVRHCERALQSADRIGDEPLRVQVRATLGQAHGAASHYDEALALLDEAIAVKRRHRNPSRPAVGFAYSLACKAAVLGDRGQFHDAREGFDEALDAVRGPHHEVEASIHGLRSAVYLWQGRWEDARDSARDAYRIAERVRSLFSFSMSHAAGAYAPWMLDRRPESLQAIADATAWLEPRKNSLFRSLNFGWRAEALVTSGRLPEARHHAARALMRARQHDRIGGAMAYRALARAAAQARDLPTARRYLALAMRMAHARNSRHELAVNQWCEAAIEWECGDALRAAPLLDAASAAFERMEMCWHLEQAAALRLLAAPG